MPTDREIAEMILRGGGAGSISEGGMIFRPLNVKVPYSDRLDYGLPEATSIVATPKSKEPENKAKPIVGGVQSSAWDRGYTGPKE